MIPQPFWHQRLASWKTQARGWGMGLGGFKCITFTVCFISIIITSALPQIIRHYIVEVEDPFSNVYQYPPLMSFTHEVVPDCLQLHGLQCSRLPCPSPSPTLAHTLLMSDLKNSIYFMHAIRICFMNWGLYLSSWEQ